MLLVLLILLVLLKNLFYGITDNITYHYGNAAYNTSICLQEQLETRHVSLSWNGRDRLVANIYWLTFLQDSLLPTICRSIRLTELT